MFVCLCGWVHACVHVQLTQCSLCLRVCSGAQLLFSPVRRLITLFLCNVCVFSCKHVCLSLWVWCVFLGLVFLIQGQVCCVWRHNFGNHGWCTWTLKFNDKWLSFMPTLFILSTNQILLCEPIIFLLSNVLLFLSLLLSAAISVLDRCVLIFHSPAVFGAPRQMPQIRGKLVLVRGSQIGANWVNCLKTRDERLFQISSGLNIWTCRGVCRWATANESECKTWVEGGPRGGQTD